MLLPKTATKKLSVMALRRILHCRSPVLFLRGGLQRVLHCCRPSQAVHIIGTHWLRPWALATLVQVAQMVRLSNLCRPSFTPGVLLSCVGPAFSWRSGYVFVELAEFLPWETERSLLCKKLQCLQSSMLLWQSGVQGLKISVGPAKSSSQDNQPLD